MSIKKISKGFSVTIENDKYYVIEIFDEKEFSISDLKKLVEFQRELGSKKMPVLILCSENTTGDVSMLKHLAYNKNNPFSAADAFVIYSVAQKIIGNFYLKIIAPERPTKMFTNKNEAISWLNQFY